MPVLTVPVQLSPRLFVVYAECPHVDSSNVFLVAGQKPTLIDCGSARAVPRLLANLTQLGLDASDVDRVIATHGDYDHIQGFHDLRRLHPGMRLNLHRNDWQTGEAGDVYRTCSYLYGQPFAPIEAGACDPIVDGDELPAGDGFLRVVHTPGHTEGSVCLLGEVDGRTVLFAGDAIGGAMKSLDGATLDIWAQAATTWRNSLLRLAGLDFDWVLNGHEPAASLPLSRAHFDRMVPSFGKMMNPWFHLGDDEVAPVIATNF